MAGKTGSLSTKAVIVLQMIADGRSYEQILSANPGFGYLDIFRAAAEALHGTGASAKIHARERHARAYEKWTPEEEARLDRMVREGRTVAQIAGTLERQRSAIRGRIARLGLVSLLSPKEQTRFRNAAAQDQTRGLAVDGTEDP